MQNKTTIHINGRTYDAKSGKLLRDVSHHQPGSATGSPHSPTQRSVPPAIYQPANKQFVDGFVRGTPPPAKPAHPVLNRPKPVAPQHGAATARSRQPSHLHHASIDAAAVHHKTRKSETLMRRAVKQPAAQYEPATKIQPKRGVAVKSLHSEAAKSARSRLAETPHNKFVAKATSIPKSNVISHFTPKTPVLPASATGPVPVNIKTIDLKSPPPGKATHHHAGATYRAAQPQQAERVVPAPQHRQPRSHAIMQRGLMAANSHEQRRPAYKKSSRRTLLSVGAGSLAALLLAGYISYLSIPNIAMRVAASKAGFSASLPDSPSGYSMKGPIKYAPGRITFSLRSNSSDNTIAVTERSSNWDSQSLLKNHVRPAASGEYEAVEASGRTLYMYGKSVTWVHGGVWYQIDGNDQLGRDQLIKIATSM